MTFKNILEEEIATLKKREVDHKKQVLREWEMSPVLVTK